MGRASAALTIALAVALAIGASGCSPKDAEPASQPPATATATPDAGAIEQPAPDAGTVTATQGDPDAASAPKLDTGSTGPAKPSGPADSEAGRLDAEKAKAAASRFLAVANTYDAASVSSGKYWDIVRARASDTLYSKMRSEDGVGGASYLAGYTASGGYCRGFKVLSAELTSNAGNKATVRVRYSLTEVVTEGESPGPAKTIATSSVVVDKTGMALQVY